MPYIIIGDFDSLRQEVKEFYEQKGTLMKHETDQDTIDFEKSLSYIISC